MEKSVFLLENGFREVERKFVKDGWIDICRDGNGTEGWTFCCLVAPSKLKNFLKDRSWGVEKGSEGRPCIFGPANENDCIYQPFCNEGFEPFLYYKRFSYVNERYIDVSEEFVNYFQLYEQGESKQKRSYYFFDEVGNKEEVLKVTPEGVKVKQRFLIEYISVRQMHFSIAFSFEVMEDLPIAEYVRFHRDEDYVTDDGNYNHLVRVVPGSGQMQSWLLGKVIIKYDPKRIHNTWYDPQYDHEEFIIGYDDNGDLKRVPCDSEEHEHFCPVFFKKDVLTKYYNDPVKYEVNGFNLSCQAFSLKMDNNGDEYVTVFLNDLRMLPQKEQLHWKHYNIVREDGMGISGSYYDTMVNGSWARKSDALDIRFKQEYQSFNKTWFEKYGWHFYKQPSGADIHLFNGLHLPADNSVVSFCNQILTVVKFTIDSLNEEMLVKDLPKIEMEKGIAKFERFIKHKGHDLPYMFSFLKHLQDLRSSLIAHKFSESNKNAKRALAYFEMKHDNYREVAITIIGKSLWTVNTLRRLFLEPVEDGTDLC
ncbi:hypothetical protein [Chitinophaga sancti]|uniref:Uncharacterized protein n=1 Tax=Chitinophaga sancti TaxID=1004 RepID=A0A1K1RW49_9BACT|nr:hypothetical protein [Chitinophaga sancti]WQD63984.1 hypothetical protein U0033_06210 [Chitinophaga sancti]WQG90392.1 hypothetical protein SR876_02710 [Chitinophaga sancti]SFW76321.1 hypothetical protein SAMN05661012_04331 [Chitinophaga sancti]